MKNYFSFVIILLTTCSFLLKANAQSSKIASDKLEYLEMLNDSLGKTSVKVYDEILPSNRLRADSLFTRMLVRGLVVPYSFYYPFDAVEVAPIIYPTDSSFRIITWHYTLNDADYRQKGVLQINTPDGSPKLFPLFDVSEYTEAPQDSIRDNRNWIGAIYYKIVERTWDNKKIYTLFGYDEHNSITTRKWIDILTFTENGEPRFGGSFFRVPYSNKFPQNSMRYLVEYKSQGGARVNFDEEEDMVIMDYLISESNEPDKLYTLVPGGDYSGLKWNSGAWEYIPKLEVDMLGDGNEPRPALILNSDGTSNEGMLQKYSDKNMEQAAEKEKKKTKPVKGKKGQP